MAGNSTADLSKDRTSVIVGIILLIVAGVLWYDANSLGRAVAYGVGPEVMPKVIAVGLIGLGLASIVSGFRSTVAKPPSFDIGAIVIIIAGFLALTAIIGLGGGFLPAMTVLFAATSWAFGRRALLVDMALGFVIALATYLLFSKLLSLSLPRGPIETLIG